ncbi:MAG: 6-phosphogluconolactonase [Alphaproteobacteria bacterium]
MIQHLTQAVDTVLRTALQGPDNRPLIALSGGSTPRGYMPAIAALPLDWGRVDWMLADERLVPRDHADSNEALNRDLMAGTAMETCGFVDLRQLAGQQTPPPRWPIDLVLLGMGDDGHIASLFPQSPALTDPAPIALEAEAPPAPHPPHRRATLSVPALTAARHVFLVISGDNKVQIWEQARSGASPTTLPAALLADHPGLQVFHV